MGIHFIGIDIGTSKICGVIYDLENRKLHSIIKENTSNLEATNCWEDLQDPYIILLIVKEILDEFIQLFGNIKGIGITGQMHGILYTDRDGKSISPLFTWQDGRGNEVYKNDRSYAYYLSEISGYPLASGYGLVSHFYNQVNALIPLNSHRICTIMDFIAMNLSGRTIPVTDDSNAASLGFFDLNKLIFDIEAINKIDIDPSILPEVIPSGEIIGNYKNDIYVCNAIGDNQASFLGSVNEIERSILVNIGTASQISIYVKNFVIADKLDLRPFPGGGYMLVGSALSGGQSLVILKNFFEEVINLFSPLENASIDFYNKINSLDYSNETTDSLDVEVLFRGTRHNSTKRGSINNISTMNLTPINLISGFLNGICNELYDFYNHIPEKNTRQIERLIGSGNAIRRNIVLCKMLENKFGHKLIIPSFIEEAAFGASLCSIVGGKYADSFLEIGKIINYMDAN
jgi:sedoheptulokinase